MTQWIFEPPRARTPIRATYGPDGWIVTDCQPRGGAACPKCVTVANQLGVDLHSWQVRFVHAGNHQ